MNGRIVQISVSPGGVPKTPVTAARAGALGENITVEGIDWAAVLPGSRLRLGDSVLFEVTRYTSPCASIAPAFSDRNYSRVSQKHHPGWSRVYARVLAAGSIRQGDPVRLLMPGDASPGATAAT